MPLEKKEKIQIGITGILIIVLIYMIAGLFRKKAVKNGLVNQSMPYSATLLNEPLHQEPLLYHKLEVESQAFDYARDPFFEVPSDLKGIILKGIFWEVDKGVAVFNDEIVQVGGSISGYEVADIHADKVILNTGVGQEEIFIGDKVKESYE